MRRRTGDCSLFYINPYEFQRLNTPMIPSYRSPIHLSECSHLFRSHASRHSLAITRICSRSVIINLATRYGRYGYRRITALLKELGWQVNHKRVERIWRREGLRVTKKQPTRGQLWLGDSSLIRLQPERVEQRMPGDQGGSQAAIR